MGVGNGNCSQFIALFHCFCLSFLFRGKISHNLPLLQCGIPPWTSPVWVLPMGCSSSVTSPAWFPSLQCNPSEQAAPGHFPCRITSPASKPAPAQTLYRVAVSFRHTQLLRCGVSHRLQVLLCIPTVLHGLQGDRCLTMGFQPCGLDSRFCEVVSASFARERKKFESKMDAINCEMPLFSSLLSGNLIKD